MQFEFWSSAIDKAMATRERLGNERFIDVYQNDTAQKPIETLEDICSRYDLPIRNDYLKKVKAWIASEPKRIGRHSYTASDYGLSIDEIHERFASYIDRFNIQLET